MWRVFVSTLTVAYALLMVVSAAMSHDWYPPACCNERDCEPVPVEDVQIIDGFYIVNWGGQTIAFEDAAPSPDGYYHICTVGGARTGGIMKRRFWGSTEIRPCFFAPQGI